MDLAVDEQGLWALWGDTDNGYRLYASKIDVYSNAITDTRALTTGKSTCVIKLQWNLYFGTPLFEGHLSLFRGQKIWSQKNFYIIFVFVTSIEGTSLFRGKGHFLGVPH